MGQLMITASGRRCRRYVSAQASCAACPLRAQCLAAKARRREVLRWEHEDVIERHRERMGADNAKAMMTQRGALAEHPFGTLKCRAGWTHFLVRGFAKVRGELSLMVLAYNLARLIAILGLEALKAHLAKRHAALCVFAPASWPPSALSGGLAGHSRFDPPKIRPEPTALRHPSPELIKTAILAQPRGEIRLCLLQVAIR